tara:strand:- start:4002 stop:4517 length:516 start_codon:yes stop_codon:yes gene_type:complete
LGHRSAKGSDSFHWLWLLGGLDSTATRDVVQFSRRLAERRRRQTPRVFLCVLSIWITGCREGGAHSNRPAVNETEGLHRISLPSAIDPHASVLVDVPSPLLGTTDLSSVQNIEASCDCVTPEIVNEGDGERLRLKFIGSDSPSPNEMDLALALFYLDGSEVTLKFLVRFEQ